MSQRALISAFVVCHNEETQIRRCLESIKWCDEIVVIDSGSTDNTVPICREFTNLIHQRLWPGYVEQKRFGLLQCRHEWVLNIDADEEVSGDLRESILKVLASPNSINGFYLSRVVFYLGRWWRKGGWYPEYRLRFCRRTATSWGGADPHEKAEVMGPTARLDGELRHYTYADISQHVRRLNSHSSVAANTAFKDGQRANILKILVNPVLRFAKFYFLRLGFREGAAGFFVACMEGWYVFLKYNKLWELQQTRQKE